MGADLRYRRGAAAGAAGVQGSVQQALVAPASWVRNTRPGARRPCTSGGGGVNFVQRSVQEFGCFTPDISVVKC